MSFSHDNVWGEVDAILCHVRTLGASPWGNSDACIAIQSATECNVPLVGLLSYFLCDPSGSMRSRFISDNDMTPGTEHSICNLSAERRGGPLTGESHCLVTYRVVVQIAA